MEFTFELVGRGWARATVSAAGQQATLVPSYLTDALGDLTRAAVHLMNMGGRSRVDWENEPGDIRWELIRHGDEVRVTIGLFEFAHSIEPQQRLFDATVPVRDLADSFATAAKRIREKLGEDGYLEQWVQHPFPAQELHELDRLLGGANQISFGARLGSAVDNVGLFVYDAGEFGDLLECDLKVNTGRFTATVTAPLHRDGLWAFHRQLRDVMNHVDSRARMVTADEQCQLVITDSWELIGTIADTPLRSLRFTIPCTEADISFAAKGMSRILQELDRR